MNDVFTVPVGENSIERMSITYGLIILIDLADAFYEHGVHLNVISVKHGLPLARLEPIVGRLETAGLLERHSEDQSKLMLKQVPEGRWILEVIPLLKNALENGPFFQNNNVM